MASLPNPELTSRFLTAEELLAIRGTPEFEAEYRRQAVAVAEHDSRAGKVDRLEPDWGSIKGWE